MANEPLQYGCYYHIYNHGNNRENLFVECRNYPYFLKRSLSLKKLNFIIY